MTLIAWILLAALLLSWLLLWRICVWLQREERAANRYCQQWGDAMCEIRSLQEQMSLRDLRAVALEDGDEE